MVRISTQDLQQDAARYQAMSHVEPVTVMRDGQDDAVLISMLEYRRLRGLLPRVMTLDDFTDEDVAAIEAAEPSPESHAFDHEMEGYVRGSP